MDNENSAGAAVPKIKMTPSSIVRYLDQHVVGQNDAKKILSVVVYAHYKKLLKSQDSGIEIAKSNVLLIGPTGTGKTLLCETLARAQIGRAHV